MLNRGHEVYCSLCMTSSKQVFSGHCNNTVATQSYAVLSWVYAVQCTFQTTSHQCGCTPVREGLWTRADCCVTSSTLCAKISSVPKHNGISIADLNKPSSRRFSEALQTGVSLQFCCGLFAHQTQQKFCICIIHSLCKQQYTCVPSSSSIKSVLKALQISALFGRATCHCETQYSKIATRLAHWHENDCCKL